MFYAVTASQPLSQTVADYATAGALIVAILLGIRSDVLTRRGQDNEKQLAENAASRAEKAAALSEEYTQRVVDALEKIAGAPRPRPTARWTLELQQGTLYQLTNIGDGTAHHVTMLADESLPLDDVPEGNDIEPDQAWHFYAFRNMGTTDSTIAVGWVDDDGTDRVWRYPLPPAG